METLFQSFLVFADLRSFFATILAIIGVIIILSLIFMRVFGFSIRRSGEPQNLRLRHLADGRYQICWINYRGGDSYIALLLPIGKYVSMANPWYVLLRSCGKDFGSFESPDTIEVTTDPHSGEKRVKRFAEEGSEDSAYGVWD